MSKKDSRGEVSRGTPGSEDMPGSTRLCYVDDSRTAAYVVQRLLKPFGYQIDHFSSAEPAFVALVQEDYDLLLTDLKVSSTGMDGDELIRTLRQSGHPKISTIPIIVITGTTDAEVLVDVYDAGANQVMKKPVSADELDGHIRRLLFDGRPTTDAVHPDAGPEKTDRSPDDGNVVTLYTAHHSSRKPVPPTTSQQASCPSSESSVEKTDIPVLSRTSPGAESVKPGVSVNSVTPATREIKESSILRAMEKKLDVATTNNKTLDVATANNKTDVATTTTTTINNKIIDVEQSAPVASEEPNESKKIPDVEPDRPEEQNDCNIIQTADENVLGETEEIEQYPEEDNSRRGMRGLLMGVLGVGIVVAALLMAWSIYID